MDHRERIEEKVGVLFQIADQYLSGQIPFEKAKELISLEMVNIRPAQYEALKSELGERLKAGGCQPEAERLFELFKNYISPPFNKLQNGHPLRNYYEENNRARSYLLKMDEMEGAEAALEDWRELYEMMSGFRIHIKRQEKNFYPRLIIIGMHLQAEKAKEFGAAIVDEIDKNQELLEAGSFVDFLFNQRSLIQNFMSYLDLEERVLFPKALMSFTDRDFANLRGLDDKEGYAFIEYPADLIPKEDKSFMPKEVVNDGADQDLILSAILAAKDMGVVYYNLAGEVISVMGDQITEADLPMTEETRRGLLDGSEKNKKYFCRQGNQDCLITYSTVTDRLGKCQGLLKTKEMIREVIGFLEQGLERKKNRGIDSTQNIAELFRMYPRFRQDFYNLDDELKELQGLFGMEILKESTIGMVAKSLRIDAAELVDRINKLLISY